MSSQKTTNYDLNQWLPDDSVLRTDFNADNAKIDAALQALADTAAGKADAGELSALTDTVAGQAAQIAQKGNCFITYGTYMGDGQAGASYPSTLTFAGKPLAVFLMPQTRYGSSNSSMMMIRGALWAQYHPESLTTICTVTWGDNSVSWYHVNGDAQSQFSATTTYHYIALIVSGE